LALVALRLRQARRLPTWLGHLLLWVQVRWHSRLLAVVVGVVTAARRRRHRHAAVRAAAV